MVRTEAGDVVGFVFTWIVSLILLFLAGYNLYRQYHAIDRIKNFNYLRWLTLGCTILQLDVFLGYFLESEVLMQIGWSFWIPLATLALSVLSIRMIETYQSIVKKNFQKTMQDSNFARSMWIIHGLCFIEAIIDWLGTLFGAIIQPNNAQLQTLFYSLWKFIAVFLFCGLNYFIFKICQKCWYQLNRKMSSVGNFHSKNNEKLKYGFYKLLALFIIFSMLIVFLLIQAIVEFASYVNYKERSFIQEPILVIVFIYLPIWSGISAVCLVYSWVASKNLLKNRTKTTIDSTTKGDPTSRTKTYKSETSSSSNSDDDKTTSSPDFKD